MDSALAAVGIVLIVMGTAIAGASKRSAGITSPAAIALVIIGSLMVIATNTHGWVS